MSYLIIAILFLNLTCICYSENETFIATKEWQEIKPDQGIPPGLHIRLNLETGKKEAKLLEKTNEKESQVKESRSNLNSVAIKNLPKSTKGIEFDPRTFKKINKDYKSYSELRKTNFKSDAEIISELIKDFQNLTKHETKLQDVVKILDSLNYLVHQIDNAMWFIQKNGLDLILLPNIVNNTNIELRVQSMRILGALTQNNPNAQISVYEKNFGNYISQVLLSAVNTDELSTAIYAFGSLLRKFPLAQKSILSRSGIRSLITVLSKDCEIKIKAKAITLISDLIVEKDLASTNAATQDASIYFELNYKEWLTAHEFCQIVDDVLSQHVYDLIEKPDTTEYFVQALEVTQHICQQVWSESAQLRHTLLTLKNRFIQRNEEISLDVANLIEKLTRSLFNSGIKDEL